MGVHHRPPRPPRNSRKLLGLQRTKDFLEGVIPTVAVGVFPADCFQGLLQRIEPASHLRQFVNPSYGVEGLLQTAVVPDKILKSFHGDDGVNELFGAIGRLRCGGFFAMGSCSL